MPDRQLVQLILIEPPFWHKLIHQGYETGVMSWLQQVYHLMHNDVLQALRWLFGQIGIEPDALGTWTAATPLSLHSLHEEPFNLHAH